MKTNTALFLIREDFFVKQVMKHMSEIGQKTLFVVDEKNKLLGAITDGDIRKWILAGRSLRGNIKNIYNKKPKFVKENYKLDDVKKLMISLLIETVPVVNYKKEVLKVLTWEEILANGLPKQKPRLNSQVVIMAGGKGTRLDPFTRVLPKPLIPIGDKPIIELIMDKFGEYGIRDFFVSINHKSSMIKSYFEEANTKYKISYIEENKPLGTAGSLRLLKGRIKEPFIITNCDIIIKIDYSEILKFHMENRYDMTLLVSCHHYIIPYGICEIENGGILKDIKEKPEYDLLVNTGMYVMQKNILELIPVNTAFNINELIVKARNSGYKVGVFPISEHSWIDIGQWEEYRKVFEKIKLD